ncbi:MAG: radical SAM protein [Candidatus Bathyarchaeia archaeon]
MLFLELPSPPGKNVIREPFGGFGRVLPSKRKRFGFDKSIVAFQPIFPAYTATILEKQGYDCNIIDAQVLDLDLPELLREVEKIEPDAVVARISLPAAKEELKIMAQIKDLCRKVITIGWGAICRVEPDKVILQSRIDFVIRDELEFTLPLLIKKVENGESFSEVPGITFRKGHKIVSNPSGPFIMNLDVLPIASYHLLQMDKYFKEGSLLLPGVLKKGIFRYSGIYSSRGCSYNCVYCGNPVALGPWRAMSPTRIVDEVEFLIKNYDVKVIRFMDPCFNMDVNRAEKICDEIINRNLDFYWTCEARADKLTRQLVRKMKTAGCSRIELGVETGDPNLLENIGKRGCNLSNIKKAFRLAQIEGISTCAFLMVGLPGESWKTVQNTKKLLKEIKPNNISISIVTPFPGTPLYEMAEQNGWLLTTEWENYTARDPVTSLPGFSCNDMKKAFMYLNGAAFIKYGLREVARSLQGFDLITLIRQSSSGLRHIYNMIECWFKGE